MLISRSESASASDVGMRLYIPVECSLAGVSQQKMDPFEKIGKKHLAEDMHRITKIMEQNENARPTVVFHQGLVAASSVGGLHRWLTRYELGQSEDAVGFSRETDAQGLARLLTSPLLFGR